MIPKPITQFCRATNEPLTSGGATSALYIGTSILFAPMPNPLDYGVVRPYKALSTRCCPRTCDETAAKNCSGSVYSRCALHNNSNDEDSGTEENAVS